MTTIPTINNIDYLVSLIETSTNPEETFKDNIELFKNFINEYSDKKIEDALKSLNCDKVLKIISFCLKYDKGELKEIYFPYACIEFLYYSFRNTFYDLDATFAKKLISFLGETFVNVKLMERVQFISDINIAYKFIGINPKEIKLIDQIINCELKDEEILIEMIRSGLLFKIYNQDLKRCLEFIESVDYVNENKLKMVTHYMFDSLLNSDDSLILSLLELVIKGNESPLWKTYITDSKRKEILEKSISLPITRLTNEQIKYFLKLKENPDLRNDIDEYNWIIFETNCRKLIKNNVKQPKGTDINLEEIRNICEQLSILNSRNCEIPISEEDAFDEKIKKARFNATSGCYVDMKTAIEFLKYFLKKENSFQYDQDVEMILGSIMRNVAKMLKLEFNGIYLFDSGRCRAQYSADNDDISFNYRLIMNCRGGDISIFELIYIILHEISHCNNVKRRISGFFDFETYEKNKHFIMSEYTLSFYKNNYMTIKEEIDARLDGLNRLQKFVEEYLPEYLNELQDSLIVNLEKEIQKDKKNIKMQVLWQNVEFQTAFDALVRYNPDILEEHPILKLEYYPNGLPKTYEDIWLSRTEQNKDLIDGILNARYPDPTNKSLAK